MKTLAILAYGVVLAAGVGATLATAKAPEPAPPADQKREQVCLQPALIQSTQVKDNRTIIFRMRNGDVWENRLVANCPGLKSPNLFWTQVVPQNRICSFRQPITLQLTGQVCWLGAFTLVKSD